MSANNPSANNPFDSGSSGALEDPAVTNAAGGTAEVRATSGSVENPFDKAQPPQNQPPYPSFSNDPPPAFEKSANADQVNVSIAASEGFPGEQGRVESDAEKIRRLELENDRLRNQVAGGGREGGGDGEFGPDTSEYKNWPPCYPIAHNDIPGDFPEDTPQKACVQMAYYVLLANFFAIVWNFICMCAYASGGLNDDKFSSVGVAIAFILLGIPGAFYIWYRVVYAACQYRRVVLYFIAMCTLMASCLFWVCACIGFPGSGLAGFWVCITQFDNWNNNSDGDATTYLVTAAFMVIQLVIIFPLTFFSFRLWQQVRAFYRGEGGNDKMAEETAAARGVANAAMSSSLSSNK